MLIAQMTDLHIGFEPNNPDEPNAQRLKKVVASLLSLDPAPDALLITGDLTENGDADSYARLNHLLSPLTIPSFVVVGNHDVREQLLAAFPGTRADGDFVQYAVDFGGKRLIILDTKDDVRQGGAFCERRGEWLRACLAQAPHTPTLIALHHPPLSIGIDWMDPAESAPWTERLREIVAAAPQVAAVVGGHVHRPLTARWAETLYVGASSTAPQLGLGFRSTDTQPDGRALIVCEAPAYALHRWTDAGVMSHFMTAGDHPAVIRFNDTTRRMIAHLKADALSP